MHLFDHSDVIYNRQYLYDAASNVMISSPVALVISPLFKSVQLEGPSAETCNVYPRGRYDDILTTLNVSNQRFPEITAPTTPGSELLTRPIRRIIAVNPHPAIEIDSIAVITGGRYVFVSTRLSDFYR